MFTRLITVFTLMSLLGLAACTRNAVRPDNLVSYCKAEVAPGGTYEYDEGAEIPVMRPVGDGTPEGAAAFNACIRDRAVSKGLLADPITGRTSYVCKDGAPIIYGGATYCIGTF